MPPTSTMRAPERRLPQAEATLAGKLVLDFACLVRSHNAGDDIQHPSEQRNHIALSDRLRLPVYRGIGLERDLGPRFSLGEQFAIIGGWVVLIYAIAFKVFRWE